MKIVEIQHGVTQAKFMIHDEESKAILEVWEQRQEGDDVGFDVLDSRFIHTNKVEESGPRAKSWWCVAGYQEGGLK